MRRKAYATIFSRFSLAAGLAVALSAVVVGDEFFMGFDGVPSLRGNPGATVSTSIDVTLRHDNPDGSREASGWSFSVVADNASIVDITTNDTISCERNACPGGLAKEGFNKTELSLAGRGTGDCNELGGALSAVILALIDKVTLPSDVTHVVARLQVEAQIPVVGEQTAVLRYTRGCAGSGLPVPTVISQGDNSLAPTQSAHEITLLKSQCFCAAQIAVAFSESGATSGTASWQNTIGTTGPVDPDDPCGGAQNCDGAGVLDLTGNSGAVVSGRVYANLVSQIPQGTFGQVSGWSLSIEYQSHDPGSALTEVTTHGTAACSRLDCPAVGLRDDGFDQTSLIVPEENNGMQGLVSAVVLSLVEDVRVPFGMSTVLEITFQATIPEESTTSGPETSSNQSLVGSLILRDQLRGLGQPVDNVAASSGVAFEYENADTARVDVFARASSSVFVRGNANGDSKVDIADTIWLVNFLFRNGATPPCLDAADVNDNELVELSDALFLLAYFFGGPAVQHGFPSIPPPAPFPDCGKDPSGDGSEQDALDCQSSVICN